VLVLAVRFAVAIVLDALAFTVWDVGTRPPARLLRDAAGAVWSPRALGLGLLRFVVGLALLVAGALVARPALTSIGLYTIVETGMLFVALVVEQLVGPDLRAAVRRPRPAP
jgi:hypothetical protein